MRKQIAAFEYRNGRFGVNTVSINRVFPGQFSSGGYSVNIGHGDSWFVRSPVEAKQQYRDAMRYAIERGEYPA